MCSDLSLDEFPAFMALKSVHNIPIEAVWRWLLKFNGIGVREVIEEGKINNLFNGMNQMHWYVCPFIYCYDISFLSQLFL
jgi:hypothetical protein